MLLATCAVTLLFYLRTSSSWVLSPSGTRKRNARCSDSIRSTGIERHLSALKPVIRVSRRPCGQLARSVTILYGLSGLLCVLHPLVRSSSSRMFAAVLSLTINPRRLLADYPFVNSSHSASSPVSVALNLIRVGSCPTIRSWLGLAICINRLRGDLY